MCIFVVFHLVNIPLFSLKLKNNDTVVRLIFLDIEKQGTRIKANNQIGQFTRIKEDTLASLNGP